MFVFGESGKPEYTGKNLSEQRTHKFNPFTALIFSINDLRSHKLLAWFSDFLQTAILLIEW